MKRKRLSRFSVANLSNCPGCVLAAEPSLPARGDSALTNTTIVYVKGPAVAVATKPQDSYNKKSAQHTALESAACCQRILHAALSQLATCSWNRKALLVEVGRSSLGVERAADGCGLRTLDTTNRRHGARLRHPQQGGGSEWVADNSLITLNSRAIVPGGSAHSAALAPDVFLNSEADENAFERVALRRGYDVTLDRIPQCGGAVWRALERASLTQIHLLHIAYEAVKQYPGAT
ncbi:jg1563 [Pararge aegeria aegeria]|uniref:Jg1563 protein n=1 Tax=Pararge aegeria aegeria TaxID=348720 RepID=A0A8S4REF2_9NEOP|nr:jg1563 [Pararge aegeria aegeria]